MQGIKIKLWKHCGSLLFTLDFNVQESYFCNQIAGFLNVLTNVSKNLSEIFRKPSYSFKIAFNFLNVCCNATKICDNRKILWF